MMLVVLLATATALAKTLTGNNYNNHLFESPEDDHNML
jgi:hypothetical protein